jgi:hypothetical protein
MHEQGIVSEAALSALKDRLADPVESCRETAILSLIEMCKQFPESEVDSILPVMLPVLSQRMGQCPTHESSEDLRFAVLSLPKERPESNSSLIRT